ncbi:MAG: DUF6790 family protein [Actinomycetota bacterium]
MSDRMESTPTVADPRPSRVVMISSYIACGVAIGVGAAARSSVRGLEIVTLWGVGSLGILSFVRHSILHASDAARMGWSHGRRNEFQIEVGFANLAIGLVAAAAVVWRWGVAAQAAVTIVYAIYLLLAAVLHVISIIGRTEERSARAAWLSALATFAVSGLFLWMAVTTMSLARVSPF